MNAALPVAFALACLAAASCSKGAQSPRPEHSEVAGAMPDAASTPGAQGGQSTAAPHAPPPATTLSDTNPTPAVPAAANLPPPAKPGAPAAGSPASKPSQ